jgi:hypothetical protein
LEDEEEGKDLSTLIDELLTEWLAKKSGWFIDRHFEISNFESFVYNRHVEGVAIFLAKARESLAGAESEFVIADSTTLATARRKAVASWPCRAIFSAFSKGDGSMRRAYTVPGKAMGAEGSFGTITVAFSAIHWTPESPAGIGRDR